MSTAEYHLDDVGAGEGIVYLMQSSDPEDPVLGRSIGVVPETSSSDEGSVEFIFREEFTDLSEAETLSSSGESLILKAVRRAIADEEEDFVDLEVSPDSEVVNELSIENPIDRLVMPRLKSAQVTSLPKSRRLSTGNHPFCDQCQKECTRIMWISGPGRPKKIAVAIGPVDQAGGKKHAGDIIGKKGRKGGRRLAAVSGKRDHRAMCARGHTINVPIPKSFRNRMKVSSQYWSHSPPSPPSPDSLPFPRFLMQMRSESSSDDEANVYQT